MKHTLSKIISAGFTLELEGEYLAIQPFSKLTQSQLKYLKDHKSEIIRELKAANNEYCRDPLDDRRFCHECRNLVNGRCLAQNFRPVDNIPRRCPDYGAIQETWVNE